MTLKPPDAATFPTDSIFDVLTDRVDLLLESPINVKDTPYGAAGDGVTDDTTAIQAAIDAATLVYAGTGALQTVFFPSGAYRLTLSGSSTGPTGENAILVALTIKDGVVLQGAPGARLLLDAIPHTTLTGSQALSGATLTVGSTTDFPSSGSIQFEDVSDIVVYTGKTATTFTGCSGGSSTGAASAAVVLRRSTALVGSDWPALTSDFQIRDMIFDGTNTQEVEIDATAITLGACQDFGVTGCEFKHFLGKAFHVLGESNGGSTRVPQRWRFNNNHVHDCASNAVGFSGTGSYDFEICDNFIHDIQATAAESIISLTQPEVARGVISRNAIKNWGTVDVGGDDIVVSENYIDAPSGSSGPGVRVHLGSRIRVLNNTVDISAASDVNCHAIAFNGSAMTDVRIVGNHILRNAASGVLARPSSGSHSRFDISGNTITGGTNAEGAIALTDVVRSVVANNSLEPDSGTANPGINCVGTCRNLAVTGNVIRYGNIVLGAYDSTVTGNTVIAGAEQAALTLYASGHAVSGNKLTGGTTGGGTTATVEIVAATDCVVAGNTIENPTASKKWINEQASSNRNLFADNTLIGTTGTVTLVGAASRLKRNVGYVTENTGSGSKANGDTISHGLASTPTQVTVTASAAKHIVAVTTVGASTFTIALHDDTGSAVAVAETVYWRAEV